MRLARHPLVRRPLPLAAVALAGLVALPGTASAATNDSFRDAQFGLDQVHAEQAWRRRAAQARSSPSSTPAWTSRTPTCRGSS